MLQNLHGIVGYAIGATDGDLGKVNDFYFDDATWTIRYLVAETGILLFGRMVLISVFALDKPDWETHTLRVNLSSDQVRHSPDIDTDLPVERRHETALHEYYQWPRYWEAGYAGSFSITPFPLLENPLPKEPEESEKRGNPHLHSMQKITGYRIHALDGEIGQVSDFIVNDQNWAVQHFVATTGHWLPGKKVLLSPTWIKNITWDNYRVYLDCTQEFIKNSTAFDAAKLDLRA